MASKETTEVIDLPINEKFGLRSDAKAMILSLPVEDLVQVH